MPTVHPIQKNTSGPQGPQSCVYRFPKTGILPFEDPGQYKAQRGSSCRSTEAAAEPGPFPERKRSDQSKRTTIHQSRSLRYAACMRSQSLMNMWVGLVALWSAPTPGGSQHYVSPFSLTPLKGSSLEKIAPKVCPKRKRLNPTF